MKIVGELERLVDTPRGFCRVWCGPFLKQDDDSEGLRRYYFRMNPALTQ